jgi:hemerythrin-like domain-containing protein
MDADRIIRDEHRSLSAVLHGMAYLVREIRERGVAPDFKLFAAMVHYIDAFPEQFHHPKEDRYLFRRLRMRCAEAAPLLDRLEAEHRVGAELIRKLEQSLARYEHGGPGEFARFAADVDAYLEHHWRHMRAEEDEVLPLARTHLTPEDWQEIDEAFLGHTDPMLGAHARSSFQALFSRIVNLAPPPIGVGPVSRADV